MKKIGIVTDSCSGFTSQEAQEKNIKIVAMPFTIDNQHYLEGVDLTPSDFYIMMDKDLDIKTSMPSLASVEEAWLDALKDYDQIIYLPLSGELSGSYQAAAMYASSQYPNQVFVVDSRRVSIPQKDLIKNTYDLIQQGKSLEDILSLLEENALNSVIYVLVDDLKHLQKGGRITPAVAKIGGLLGIKPILRFQGTKIDLYKTARTTKGTIKTIKKALEKDLDHFHCQKDDVSFAVAYSSLDDTYAKEIVQDLKDTYALTDIACEPLALVLASHIGPNGIGIAINKNI